MTDDDAREIAIPFSFPFFGQRYAAVWVNSDGSLSFNSGDRDIQNRSLGRFLSSSPRIAPLMTDLDPSRNGASITVKLSQTELTVTWISVPEYSSSGRGRIQTFQVRLSPTGQIDVSWANVSVAEAVVGISQGGRQNDATLVSFLNDASATYTGSIAERFTSTASVDLLLAAQKFYQSHDDSYDYLVFYNNLGIPASADAVAYEITVRNSREGYGDPMIDAGRDTGSGQRLQSLLNMGPLSNYPADVNGRIALRGPTPDTPLTILAHEAGHLFLAYASVPDDEAPNNAPMLNATGVHWALTFNSEASLLEGHRIQDQGPGANPRFLTTGAVEGFSPLDQYLMGLRAKEEVPDTFYVARAGAGVPVQLPRIGASFNGLRRNVTVDEVVAAVGRRTPDHTVAQRRFRFAFILISAAGQQPAAEDVARVDTYRREFETFYAKATSDRAVADTTLRRSLTLSSWPAVGLAVGREASPASVSLASPAGQDVAIRLSTRTGRAQVAPAVVIIRAGETSAQFTLQAGAPGPDILVAEPADQRYETAELRIGATAPGAQVIQVVSGDGQAVTQPGQPLSGPIRVKVTDENKLPYPGVWLAAAPLTGGGRVEQSLVRTSPDGIAEFRWTPGASAEPNELWIGSDVLQGIRVAALSGPALASGSVYNAASLAPGIVPGGLARAWGHSLSTTSGTTEVLVNRVNAKVLAASTGEVTFVVPESTAAPGRAEIVVRTAAGSSDAAISQAFTAQPGIFFDSATGYGAVVGTRSGVLTQLAPAATGEEVDIYLTGLGAAAGLPQVVIGGMNALVSFSGTIPGSPGMYLVRAVVPQGLQAGAQALSIAAGGSESNTVRIETR